MNSNSELSQKNEETRFYDDLFERLKSGEEGTATDNDTFYESIIEQLNDSQEEIAKCFKSFLIDFFIYTSKSKHFVDLFELVAKEETLKEYLNDVKISRAFEAFMLCAGNKLDKSNGDRIKTLLKRIGNYCVENFNDIVNNEFVIYVLRSFILVIGNKDPFEQTNKELSTSNTSNSKKKQHTKNSNSFYLKAVNKITKLPDEWKLKKYLKKFYELLDKDKILEMSLVNYKSPFLILLMHNLNASYPELNQECIKLIHKKMKLKENSFHPMIQDAVGSRFIEAFMCLSDDTTREHYFEKFLLPNVASYTSHIYANYVLQSLLRSLNDENQLKTLYTSLLSQVEKLLNFDSDHLFKHHLLIQLIETCKKKSYDTQELLKTLYDYFNCSIVENQLHLIRLILIGKKYDDVTKETSIREALFYSELKPISSIIAVKLLELNEKVLHDGFRDLTPNELEHLCTDNVGSHFIEESINYFEKTKNSKTFNELVEKLKGRLMIIACNKSGSFVMEHLWKSSSLNQRVDICDELKQNENQLRVDRYGRFFYNKIGLNFYKRKADEWKRLQAQEIKKKSLFTQLLVDDEKCPSENVKRKFIGDKDKPVKKKKKWFFNSK